MPERGEGAGGKGIRAPDALWRLKPKRRASPLGRPSRLCVPPTRAHLPPPLLRRAVPCPGPGPRPRAPRRERTPSPAPALLRPSALRTAPPPRGGARRGYVRRGGSDGGRGSAGRSMGEPRGSERRGAARCPCASPRRAPHRGFPRPLCIRRRHCQGGWAAGRLSPPRLPFSTHGRAPAPPSRTLTGGGSCPGCPLAFGGGRGQERWHRRSGASRAICLY